MNKRIVLSSLVGTVVSFFLSMILYGFILKDFVKANTPHFDVIGRPDDIKYLPLYIISGFAWSWIFAYIFDKWSHPAGFMDGAKIGAAISLAIAISYDTALYGMFDLYTSTYIIVDIILAAIWGAIVAGCIAMIISRMSSTATT